VPKTAEKPPALEDENGERAKRWLEKDDYMELAKKGGVVLIRRLGELAPFEKQTKDGVRKLKKIQFDLLVLAPASRAGEFWAEQDSINRGIVASLEREQDGDVVPFRVETKKHSEGGLYPILQPTEASEWKLVEDTYKAQKVDIDAPDADEQLFTKLRKAHESNARAAGNGNGSAAADDDQPPF
jgi:hypothetical protein